MKCEILIELYPLLDENNNIIFALFCYHCIYNVYCLRLLLLSYVCMPVVRVEENRPSIIILTITDL